MKNWSARVRICFTIAFIALVFCIYTKTTSRQWHGTLSTKDCPPAESKFVTVIPGGRLGNGIFEYLSVWAYAQENDAIPVVPYEILTQLSVAFENFKITILEEMAEVCNADFLTEVLKDSDKYAGDRKSRLTILPQVTVLRKYAYDWKTLIPYWTELYKNLQFRHELQAESQKAITEISLISNTTEFVAVHVRRTDYLKYIASYKNATAANASYFIAAMDQMRKMLPSPPVFLVSSDDPTWCEENINTASDTFVIAAGTPESDLALLAQCNHTIFDYGTYGMTVAMFNAEGHTIVYDTGSSDYFVTYPFATRLKNWTKLTN